MDLFERLGTTSPLVLWLLPLACVGFAEITSRGIGTQLSESGVTVTSQAAALMTVPAGTTRAVTSERRA